jgi:hypothetical protein
MNEVVKEYGEGFILRYQKAMIRRLKTYYKGRVILFSIFRINPNWKNTIETVSKEMNWEYFHNDRIISQGGTFSAQNDFHPNKKGSAMIAEDLLNYLKTSTDTPCK